MDKPKSVERVSKSFVSTFHKTKKHKQERKKTLGKDNASPSVKRSKGKAD